MNSDQFAAHCALHGLITVDELTPRTLHELSIRLDFLKVILRKDQLRTFLNCPYAVWLEDYASPSGDDPVPGMEELGAAGNARFYMRAKP